MKEDTKTTIEKKLDHIDTVKNEKPVIPMSVKHAIEQKLVLPTHLPALFIDELQIFYKGFRFTAGEKYHDEDHFIRVYTEKLPLVVSDSPERLEDDYRTFFSQEIKRSQDEFIKNIDHAIKEDFVNNKKAISKEDIINYLNTHYEKNIPVYDTLKRLPGGIDPKHDESIITEVLPQLERCMILDKRLYSLQTIDEYLERFKKAIEPNFFDELIGFARSNTPKSISQFMEEYKHLIHRKVYSMARNIIWHSERSGKIFLDNKYWIPVFSDKVDSLHESYYNMLEKLMKSEAIARDLDA